MSRFSDPQSGNLTRNLVTLGLIVVVLGLGYRVYLLEQRQAAHPETIARKAGVEPRTASQPSVVPTPATSPEAGAVAPAETKAPENPMAAMMAMSAQMMNSPAMQEMMAAGQKREMERQYAAILEQLQFTPDQRARFFTAMIEGQKKQTELGMTMALKMMQGEVSAAEKEDLRRQMEEAEKASEDSMNAFFNAEFPGDTVKREAFDLFVDQIPDREQLNMLQASFVSAGLPLTPEQSTAFVKLLGEERRNAESNPEIEAAMHESGPATMPTPETLEAIYSENEKAQNKVAERAASFLSPAQLTVLKQHQAEERDQMKMGMAFSSQVMSIQVSTGK